MKTVRTLRDTTHLASLGLPRRVVDHINKMINSVRKLKDDFTTIDRATIASADILFINAANQKVLDFYDKGRSHMAAIPVFVHNPDAIELKDSVFSKYSNAKTLSMPITLVGLSEILSEITSAEGLEIELPQEPREKVNPFNILVVDDSFPVRKYLENKLPLLVAEIDDTLDLDVQFAGSGKEAVEKVTEAKGDFDMVFLDIMMEDINGYQVCKWIKKAKSSIAVVMLTGKGSPFDRVRANLSGSDDYLSKPPKDSDLKKVILKRVKLQQSIKKNQP